MAVFVLVLSGCFYSRGSLVRDNHGYTNYPGTADDEHARRVTRRHHALIAAPLELIGGAGLTALALFARSRPSDSDSVTGAVGDGLKDLAGRAVMAAIGTAAMTGGVGDAVLGATDPLFGSPLVRNGALIPADRIDEVAPASGARLTFHAAQIVSTREIGAEEGLTLFHWISPTVRVTESAGFEVAIGWRGEHARRFGGAGEVAVDRAFGRIRAGLVPRQAVGVYAGGGWVWGDEGRRAAVRGGLTWSFDVSALRIGVDYQPDVARLPAIMLTMRRDLAVD